VKKVGDGKFRTLADMHADEVEREKAMVDEHFDTLKSLMDSQRSSHQ
jgi:hypothetical protein